VNPLDKKYRTIRISNIKLSEIIFKRKTGVSIIELVGFNKETDDLYLNRLDIKDLKLIKGDLDLAYRNFL